MLLFIPISALSLKFYNIWYFSFSFDKKYSYKSSFRSKFTSYLHVLTWCRRLAEVLDILCVYRFTNIPQMSN